jgi:hypothetical protein
MGKQSFRGAGGGGAITVRSVRSQTLAEHELHPLAQELLAGERRAEHALVQASTAVAVVTGLLATTWLLYG